MSFCKILFPHLFASVVSSQRGTLSRALQGQCLEERRPTWSRPREPFFKYAKFTALGSGSSAGSARGLLRGPVAAVTTGGFQRPPKAKHKSVANHFTPAVNTCCLEVSTSTVLLYFIQAFRTCLKPVE